jgi:hypothetical protein
LGHSDVLLVLPSPRSFSEWFGARARPVHPILGTRNFLGEVRSACPHARVAAVHKEAREAEAATPAASASFQTPTSAPLALGARLQRGQTRVARREGRPLAASLIRMVALPAPEISAEKLRRVCIHEGGHAVGALAIGPGRLLRDSECLYHITGNVETRLTGRT